VTTDAAHVSGEVRSSAARYREALERRFGPARVRAVTLFGSRARGDAEPDSDADVLVVIDDLTEAERTEVVDLALVARASHGPLLSPLAWSRDEWEARLRAERRIALDIVREGIPL
jgi:predicted nucleotidyltransferase